MKTQQTFPQTQRAVKSSDIQHAQNTAPILTYSYAQCVFDFCSHYDEYVNARGSASGAITSRSVTSKAPKSDTITKKNAEAFKKDCCRETEKEFGASIYDEIQGAYAACHPLFSRKGSSCLDRHKQLSLRRKLLAPDESKGQSLRLGEHL
jgi:hypothetical protein